MRPKIELTKLTGANGRPDIMILIRNATGELAAECERLGYYMQAVGCYSIHCDTAAKIDAARNPLAKYFGR